MKYKLIGAVLWIAVGVSLWLMYKNRQDENSGKTSPDVTANDPTSEGKTTVTVPAPLMTLSDFTLTNTRGEEVTKDDLIGKPAVYSFVFSRCISTCRPITLKMDELHEDLADHDVQFVSITVDPEYDDVKRFGAFADIYDPDYDRWTFLTGPKQAIYDMIQKGFRLTVVEMFGADAKPGMEVTHTERVVLVNADGVPVKTYLILNDGERAKLKRVLQGKDDFPQPPDRGTVTIQRGDGERESLATEDEKP